MSRSISNNIIYKASTSYARNLCYPNSAIAGFGRKITLYLSDIFKYIFYVLVENAVIVVLFWLIVMNILNRFVKIVDGLNEKIGSVVMWFTTLLVLVVCYDVFTRYLLKESSVAVQELEWHIFGIIFLLGAAYTLKEDKHVRVDVLYTRLSNRGKAWINLLGSIVFLMPFAVLVILTSKDFVVNSFIIKEMSPDPGGLPARYILKACIPLGFVLLFLQSLSLAFKSLLKLIQKDSKGRQ